MSIFSWLRNSHLLRSPIRSVVDRRFRPQLEALEDRWVPSTLKVTNTMEYGKGSLGYAIAHASASGKDTIVFANNVSGTIYLSSELLITTGVTIKGPGAGLLTLTTNYNFGDPWGQSRRVFEVNASRPVTISGLTITDNGENGNGGGILNHTTLTVSGCTISESEAGNGGAIYNDGSMVLTGCTFIHDVAGYGGGVYNAGTMSISGCTFSLDRSYDFGIGGAIYNTGTLSVGTSTFIFNDIYGPYTDLGGNIFSNAQPQIGSLTASSDSVTVGSTVTLTATNITDANPGSTITQVFYYGYYNGASGTLGVLGYFTQVSPGVWTFTLSTEWLTPGTYSFYAMAMDSYGVTGLVASVAVQVN